MSFEHLSDERLLAVRDAPAAGTAFGCFYRRHQRLVVAFHMRRTANPEVAADLASETFTRAIEGRERFEDRGPGSAAAWLYGIARFVLSHHLRRAATSGRIERALPRLKPALDDADLAAITEAAGDAEVLLALAELPEAQRDAIRAYVLDDRDYEAIAADLNVEPSTVRKRVSRGLATLRDNLGATR